MHQTKPIPEWGPDEWRQAGLSERKPFWHDVRQSMTKRDVLRLWFWYGRKLEDPTPRGVLFAAFVEGLMTP